MIGHKFYRLKLLQQWQTKCIAHRQKLWQQCITSATNDQLYDEAIDNLIFFEQVSSKFISKIKNFNTMEPADFDLCLKEAMLFNDQ